jgi:hypothetical protein
MLQVPMSDADVREMVQAGAEPAMRFPVYPLPSRPNPASE